MRVRISPDSPAPGGRKKNGRDNEKRAGSLRQKHPLAIRRPPARPTWHTETDNVRNRSFVRKTGVSWRNLRVGFNRKALAKEISIFTWIPTSKAMARAFGRQMPAKFHSVTQSVLRQSVGVPLWLPITTVDFCQRTISILKSTRSLR